MGLGESSTPWFEYAALSDLIISAAALDSRDSVVVLRFRHYCLRNISVVVLISHQHCLRNIPDVVLSSQQHCLRSISVVVLKDLISIVCVIFPTVFFVLNGIVSFPTFFIALISIIFVIFLMFSIFFDPISIVRLLFSCIVYAIFPGFPPISSSVLALPDFFRYGAFFLFFRLPLTFGAACRLSLWTFKAILIIASVAKIDDVGLGLACFRDGLLSFYFHFRHPPRPGYLKR